MTSAHSKTKTGFPLAAIALCLAGATSLAHAEAGSSNGVREFLSDPQRVGSLTGMILGGALTASPAGTVAGSIIGFIVGKESMYKSPVQQPVQITYARRSFIPTAPETTAVPMLALNSPAPAAAVITPSMQQQSPSAEVKTVAPSVAMFASTSKPSSDLQTDTIAIAIDPAPTLKQPSTLEQIASLCYGGSQSRTNNPDLQALCYYHQSS